MMPLPRFRELVGGGVLSEADFWASHEYDMRQAMAESVGKTKGVSSKIFSLSSVNRMGANGSDAPTITLTPDDIHSIFTTWPSVRRLYEEKVHTHSISHTHQSFTRLLTHSMTYLCPECH